MHAGDKVLVELELQHEVVVDSLVLANLANGCARPKSGDSLDLAPSFLDLCQDTFKRWLESAMPQSAIDCLAQA